MVELISILFLIVIFESIVIIKILNEYISAIKYIKLLEKIKNDRNI